MPLGFVREALFTASSGTPTTHQDSASLLHAAKPTRNLLVGYQNKEVREGYKMIGSVFYSVGDAEQQMPLSEIKVIGYKDLYADAIADDPDFEGSSGDFMITLLNENGGAEADYNWIHPYAEGEWAENGFWDVDESLPVAQGFWFCANIWSEDVKVLMAGEVLTAPRSVPVRYGYTMITIPLGRAVELSEITPSNQYTTDGSYDTEDPDFEGSSGDFMVSILNANGGSDADFNWIHPFADGEWDEVGFWDGDHTYEVGDAVWYVANVWNEGYTLNFPGLED